MFFLSYTNFRSHPETCYFLRPRPHTLLPQYTNPGLDIFEPGKTSGLVGSGGVAVASAVQFVPNDVQLLYDDDVNVGDDDDDDDDDDVMKKIASKWRCGNCNESIL